jgi:hypothetical protein
LFFYSKIIQKKEKSPKFKYEIHKYNIENRSFEKETTWIRKSETLEWIKQEPLLFENLQNYEIEPTKDQPMKARTVLR